MISPSNNVIDSGAALLTADQLPLWLTVTAEMLKMYYVEELAETLVLSLCLPL
jgi:hypothetical protein